MPRSSNYIIDEAHSYGPFGDTRTIEAGSFVRPLYFDYVPRHVKENRMLAFNPTVDVYCYTRYGIVPIPKKIIREVGV